MYQNGGPPTVLAAALPNTSGDSLFRYAAIAAVIIAATALVLQVGVVVYRFSSRFSR